MASLIHIAEVAAILAVAYTLGWGLGYVLHRLAARPTVLAQPAATVAEAPPPAPLNQPEAVVAEALAPPAAETEAEAAAVLVAPEGAGPEPAVEPVAAAYADPVPERKPEPIGLATGMIALLEPEAQPALSPLEIPVIPAPPPLRIDPEPAPSPVPVFSAAPSVKPGVAWSGKVRGREAVPAPHAETTPSDVIDIDDAELTLIPTELPLVIDLGPIGPDSTHGEPVLPVDAVAAPETIDTRTDAEPEPVAAAAAEPIAAEPLDEDAAMRAIEGGWSRQQARALSDAPELLDVGAAVSAAQSAVEQVLARAGIEAARPQMAKPAGLARPRNGLKDDLRLISGLGALDESTLNNLGVYHFDQIANWTPSEVMWMEDHVFARGRIGHEDWQLQARGLVAARD